MYQKSAKAILCATIIINSPYPAHADDVYDSYGLAGISVTSADAHEDERAGFIWIPIAIGAVVTAGSLVAYLRSARSGGGTNIVMQEPNAAPDPLGLPPTAPAATVIGAAAQEVARHAGSVATNAGSRSSQIAAHAANSLGIVASGVSLAQGASTAYGQFSSANSTEDRNRAYGNLIRASGSAMALGAYPTNPQAATIFSTIGNVARAIHTKDSTDILCAGIGCTFSGANLYNRQHNNGMLLLAGQVASSCWSAACSYMGANTGP